MKSLSWDDSLGGFARNRWEVETVELQLQQPMKTNIENVAIAVTSKEELTVVLAVVASQMKALLLPSYLQIEPSEKSKDYDVSVSKK